MHIELVLECPKSTQCSDIFGPMFAAGQWTFSTRAQDAAGNAADISLQHNWTVSFEPGNTYVRIQNGTFGPTAQKSATFHMQVITSLTSFLVCEMWVGMKRHYGPTCASEKESMFYSCRCS